jgi:hypothetical protein
MRGPSGELGLLGRLFPADRGAGWRDPAESNKRPLGRLRLREVPVGP